MSFRFSNLMDFLHKTFFPQAKKESLLTMVFHPGLDDDEGKWKNPFEGYPESRTRKYIRGDELIPRKHAQDVLVHFSNSGSFAEEYNNLPSKGLDLISLELSASGIKCEPSDDIGLLVYHLLCAFLGAFSIGSDRISIGTPRSDLENDLLAEASYKCPRCGKKLIKEIEGTYPFRVFAELYDVYPIYPEKAGLMLCLEGGRTVYNPGNIDASNSIVLCKAHRKELFERTSPEAYYEKLSLTKGELTALDADISKAEAMDCIYEILHSIDCPDAILEKDPRFDPLKISQKISPKENQTLFNQVCTESNPYYEYIKLQLSLLDDGPRKTWSKFSKAVAIYYQENKSQDQWAVYEGVTEYIARLIPIEKTRRIKAACGYITSFFIQSCEVFDEIS